MKRIVITGSSGYLGRRLVQHYHGQNAVVLGIDIADPGDSKEEQPDEFERIDISESNFEDRLADFRADALIHSAFVFTPMRNRKKMSRINVEGTRNVLQAVSRLRIPQLCVVSSATAYGAWPDNPIPLDEASPIRARPEFQYSADKGVIEQMLCEFQEMIPEVETSWVRPAIIGGPNFDNYLRRFVFGMPFLVKSDGVNSPMQFVHESDVVSAIATILEKNGTGAFNVGPDDWSTIQEVAELSGRRAVSWPFWFTRFIHGFAWMLRLPFHESPASFLYYSRYPWVVDSKRLKQELGFQFEYSSHETLQAILEAEKK